MKKATLVLFCLGMVLGVSGKSEIKAGYYPGGEKKFSGMLQNGFQQGRWTYWYPGGRIRGQAVYQGGKLHGRCLYWNQSGDLIVDGEYPGGGTLFGPVCGGMAGEWKSGFNDRVPPVCPAWQMDEVV
jgi:hypothetical protein